MLRLGLLLLAILVAFPRAGSALPSYITFPSDVDWVTRKTDHFEIIYRRGQDDLALRTLRAAEKAHKLLTPIFPKGPDSTLIVLADFHDSTNGYSLDFPWPHFVIFAAPPEPTGILKSLDDWLDSVVLHEYVHTLQLYPANGLWKPIRSVFGPLILPNGLMPTHMHEGIATFLETELTNGGRGRGTQFLMYRRIAVEEGVWGKDFSTLDRLDGATSIWPHGASTYFFGYWLYRDLWRRKGAKGIYNLTLSESSNWPYFISKTSATLPQVKTPFQEVYGIDYPDLWKEIYDRTRDEAKKEIADIKKSKLSPLHYLTSSKYSKWDLALSPNGKQAAFRYGDPHFGSELWIVDLSTMKGDTVKPERRLRLNGGRVEGICWGRAGNEDWIVYLESKSKYNYSINRLYAYQPDREESLELEGVGFDLDHMHAFGCSPDLTRALAYREVAGAGKVLELRLNLADAAKRTQVRLAKSWTLASGSVVTALRAGTTNWSAVRTGTETLVYRWPEGEAPTKVLDTSAYLSHLRAVEDEHDFMAIADFDGRDELWHFDAGGKSVRKVVALLGGIVGWDSSNEKWYVVSYRHGGYDLAVAGGVDEVARTLTPRKSTGGRRTVEASLGPEPRAPGRATAADASATDATGSGPKLVDIKNEFKDLKISEARNYSAWGTVFPRMWIPTLLFVPNGMQAGVYVAGFDLSQKHSYLLTAGYDTRGTPFGTIDYTYRFGLSTQLTTSLYYYPSYLISARAFQKYWGASIGLGGFLNIPPFLQVSLLFTRMEPARPSFPLANQGVGVGVDLSYSFGLRSRPLDVTPYRGTKLKLSHAQYLKALGSTSDYNVTTASVEQYIEAPWKEGHVFYSLLRAGYTEGTRAFYMSYFQGGGELLFNMGRGNWLNRGFLPGTFIAQRIVTANIEYRFPILLVERGFHTNPLFLKRIHGALIFDAMTLDRRLPDYRRTGLFTYGYGSFGLELKTDWVLSYYLPAQVRVGAYRGIGPLAEELYITLGLEASL